MKPRNRLLFILSLLSVITSCGDTSPEIPEVTPPESPAIFWQQSHLAMLGWKGNVKEVKETSLLQFDDTEDGEEFSSVVWRFDNEGRLTYYNPFGMEPEAMSRGIWQTYAAYTYEYNEQGQLSKAIVDDFGGTLTTYELEYADHTKYVPLLFPLGSLEFFMVKGLETVTCTVDSDSEPTVFRFSGNTTSYTKESWEGTETTVYEYSENGNYPVKKTVTLTHGGSIVSQIISSYEYNADGSLSLIDTSAKEGSVEIERTKKRFLTGSLQPASQKTDAGGQTFDWIYSYDEDNRWVSVSYVQDKGSSEEITSDESSVYSQIDKKLNWLKAVQMQSSVVNPTHADGTVNVIREISYY